MAFEETLTSRKTSSSWYILAALLCATALCACTGFVATAAARQSTDVTVINHALVEKATLTPVATVHDKQALEQPLSADGARGVLWLELPGLTQEVVGFQRLTPASAPAACAPSVDGFCYFFSTRSATYAAAASPAGQLTFTKVSGAAKEHRRALLVSSSHRDPLYDSTTADGALPSSLYNTPRVKAAVDHLYGVNDPTCPPGTRQVDEDGNELEQLCGGYAAGYAPGNYNCQSLAPGFYDVQLQGRCLDYCFYATRSSSCGDGYWTCALGGTVESMGTDAEYGEPSIASAGTYVTMDFCGVAAGCKYPKCNNEGDMTAAFRANHTDADSATDAPTSPDSTWTSPSQSTNNM